MSLLGRLSRGTRHLFITLFELKSYYAHKEHPLYLLINNHVRTVLFDKIPFAQVPAFVYGPGRFTKTQPIEQDLLYI